MTAGPRTGIWFGALSVNGSTAAQCGMMGAASHGRGGLVHSRAYPVRIGEGLSDPSFARRASILAAASFPTASRPLLGAVGDRGERDVEGGVEDRNLGQ